MTKKQPHKWSQKVTEKSHALALEDGVFTCHDPVKIATSLKKSALESHQRKGTPYQSAMSMLNFYINRAGKNLPPEQKEVLIKAKDELRKLFDKT
jgi:hypothetical protein